MGRLSENCVLNLKNKSHSVTAEIEVPESGAEGVIVAQGANIGGWSLYAKNGKLKYCYNVAGVKHFFVESADALPAGQHQVRMEFAYAGGGLGKGGKVTLFVDGKPVGEGEIPMTQAMIFSADDGCDVGEDSGAPVSPDYGPVGNGFNGEVKGVLLSIADDPKNSDHLVTPEDAIQRRDGTAVVACPKRGQPPGSANVSSVSSPKFSRSRTRETSGSGETSEFSRIRLPDFTTVVDNLELLSVFARCP